MNVFTIKEHEGEPIETDEMKPQWFDIDKIPYDEMWATDREWLPEYLKGKKFRARIHFDKDDQPIQYEIDEVDSLDYPK